MIYRKAILYNYSMSSRGKICTIDGETFTEGQASYCQRCFNAYQRWRKRNLNRDHSMHEFREHLKLNAAMGIVDIDKAVPMGRRGRPPARREPVAADHVLEEGEHPLECGCWMCAGFDTYEAWAASEDGQAWSEITGS